MPTANEETPIELPSDPRLAAIAPVTATLNIVLSVSKFRLSAVTVELLI